MHTPSTSALFNGKPTKLRGKELAEPLRTVDMLESHLLSFFFFSFFFLYLRTVDMLESHPHSFATCLSKLSPALIQKTFPPHSSIIFMLYPILYQQHHGCSSIKHTVFSDLEEKRKILSSRPQPATKPHSPS